jgi:hypothetical protein
MNLMRATLLFLTPLLATPRPGIAAEPVAGFPVQMERGMPVKSVTIADVDENGTQEVVAIVGEGVAIIGNDGSMWAGFPKGLRDVSAKTPVMLKGPPTLCDLDGDGRREVVAAGSTRMVYAVDLSGAELSGFPVKVSGNPRGPLACLPADGRQELVLTTDAGLLLAVGRNATPRTIGKIGRGAESGVAVADLDGDGGVELIAGGGDSRLYVFDTRGRLHDGFPYKMAFRTSGIPAVGDIDDDGKPDIVFGSQDFKIHAVGADGVPLAGFPVKTKYRIYGGPALVDLNGDWVLDVVLGSGDKNVYALRGTGKPLRGFPVSAGGRVDRGCVAGDVDRDGKPDIFVLNQEGRLLWYDASGRKQRLRIRGKIVAGPALADLDADGAPEVVFATKSGRIEALELGATGKAEAALLAWPVAGHDPAHSGRFGPNPARFRDLTFANTAPATTEALAAEYRHFDLDWETEGETRVRWYRDGARVAELDNVRSVPAELTQKHQVWSYTIQGAGNHAAYGESGVLSRVYRSPTVEVQNTAPTAPAIALSPEVAQTRSPLEVAVTRDSSDADGDRITYRYVWLRGGKMVKPKVVTRINPAKTAKNQEWRIVVVPFDGEEEGKATSAALRIRNTPPGPAQIEVAPASPRIDDEPRAVIAKPAVDDDGDSVHYTYRYWVNGQALSLPETTASVPRRALRKHQKVKVEVVAHDNEEAGGAVEREFQVINTPPPAPKIAIWPATPRTTDDLRLGVLESKPDADGDQILLEHTWAVDGASAAHPVIVPSAVTRKGQRWTLTVTPFDGESRSAPISVSTTIQNTPPEPPLVTLDRYTFFTGEEVTPRIDRPAEDVDGDPIRLSYAWLRNGKPSGGTATTLGAADTAKGQIWEVRITPHDNEAAGQPVSLRFEVVNSPPTAPKIALSTQTPSVKDRVEVRVTEPANDSDRDRLVYRYRWVRDGEVMKAWSSSKATLEPGEARKGQRWRVEARAFDGEAEGEPSFADLVVRNHAPAPPRVALLPEQPRTTDPIECQRAAAGSDPDGDRLTYRTRWLLDGSPVSMSPDATRIPTSITREKQVWQCEVISFDGELPSVAARSKPVTVVNTPPEPPAVSVVPRRPTTTADLVCQLDVPSTDADLDPLSYRFVWTLNGKRWSGGELPNRVPASATRRGQTWACTVTPFDGDVEGRLARAKVSIGNSTPTSPQVRIVPERPRTGDELECEIVEASEDADGDRIRYSYTWLKDGITQSFAPTSMKVPGRLVRARDMWKCRVTPSDGKADGKPRTTQDVMVSRRSTSGRRSERGRQR